MSTFFRAAAFSLILLGLITISFAQDKGKKDESFQKIAKLANSKKPEEKEKAYELAKAFVGVFGKDTDEKTKRIKDFIDGYELDKMNMLLDSGKTDDAFLMGKEILSKYPEKVDVTLNLAYAGLDAFLKRKDDSFGGDSIEFAKQTLKFFEKGNVPKSFFPFKTQNDATAWMYVAIGTFSEGFDAKEAATNYYNALKIDSELKTQTQLYSAIANYYENQFNQLSKDYNLKHGLKTKDDAEMKADNAKIDLVLDRMIDIYARAVKIAEAEKNSGLEGIKTRFAQIYKFRKKSDAGMNELLNTILSTPMPLPN